MWNEGNHNNGPIRNKERRRTHKARRSYMEERTPKYVSHRTISPTDRRRERALRAMHNDFSNTSLNSSDIVSSSSSQPSSITHTSADLKDMEDEIITLDDDVSSFDQRISESSRTNIQDQANAKKIISVLHKEVDELIILDEDSVLTPNDKIRNKDATYQHDELIILDDDDDTERQNACPMYSSPPCIKKIQLAVKSARRPKHK